MFKTILLVLDGGPGDTAIIEHVKTVASHDKSRVIALFVGSRIADEIGYLGKISSTLKSEGVPVEIVLICEDPVTEIANQVKRKACDLVAMTGYQRSSISDFLFGEMPQRVQSTVGVPVLLFPPKRTKRQRRPDLISA